MNLPVVTLRSTTGYRLMAPPEHRVSSSDVSAVSQSPHTLKRTPPRNASALFCDHDDGFNARDFSDIRHNLPGLGAIFTRRAERHIPAFDRIRPAARGQVIIDLAPDFKPQIVVAAT